MKTLQPFSCKCWKTTGKTLQQHDKICALRYSAQNETPPVHSWLHKGSSGLNTGEELWFPDPSAVTSHPKQLQFTEHPG